MKKILSFSPIIISFTVVTFLIPVTVAGVDQVIRLYICQTEHDLDEITSWEYAAPEKYQEATKNGTLTPLEAARKSAGYLVGTEKFECDPDNQVVIERYKLDGGQKTVEKVVLSGPELAAYCPKTVKKYGDLCVP